MSKLYIQVIDSCRFCPHFSKEMYTNKAREFYCVFGDAFRIKDITKIHRNCPLEDVKVED